MAGKNRGEREQIVRHGFAARFVHWAVALSIFSLFFSGFGQFPMYKRFGVVNLPGLSWSGDYHLTLTMHYLGAMVLILAVTYHLVYHGIRREDALLPRRGDFKEAVQIIAAEFGLVPAPPSDKYLAEERLSYTFIGFNILVLIGTGLIKVIKNLPGADFSETLILYATTIHNAATVLLLLGVLGHLAAFIFKDNRALIPGMLSGKVDLEYVKRRHQRWYAHQLQPSRQNSHRIGLAETVDAEQSNRGVEG